MARKKSTVSVSAGIARPDYKLIKKESKKYNKDFKDAMYYIHYEISSKKLKAETVKYAKKKDMDHKLLDTLENHYFSVVGKGCMLHNMGSDLPDYWTTHIQEKLPVLLEIATEKQEEKRKREEKDSAKPSKQVNIQDRIRDQAAEVSATIDSWVDDFIVDPKSFKPDDYDVHTLLVTNDIKAPQARYVWGFYEEASMELEQALKATDDDVKEGYACFTKPQIKRLSKFFAQVESATNLIIESAKIKRKTRKKQPVSKEKKIEKLKFKLQDTDLGLASAAPMEILGAKELWVYNTKTRKVGKYIALDGAGLDVKGTNILGYNESESFQKTLRKPKEQISGFKKGTKTVFKKSFDELKAVETKLKPRLNEHTILLKIFK